MSLIKDLVVQKEAGVPKRPIKVEEIPGLSKILSLPLVFGFDCDYHSLLWFGSRAAKVLLKHFKIRPIVFVIFKVTF